MGYDVLDKLELKSDEFVAKGAIDEKANTLNEILPRSGERTRERNG